MASKTALWATEASDLEVGLAPTRGVLTVRAALFAQRAGLLDIIDGERIDVMAADVLARYGSGGRAGEQRGPHHVGAFEETTDREPRDLFELHVFGPARLTRALLPQMRERGEGSVVNVSSIGGQLSFAGFSAYSATKAALEQLSEGLADEVAPFRIKVLIVEPGAFRTNLFGKGTAYFSEENPAYVENVGATRQTVQGGDGSQPGDPAKAAAAIRRALDAEKTLLRLALGGDAVDLLTAHLDAVRTELTEWEEVSRGTDFDTE
ncbi:SDR family NAD(P)-dependent oxidoreductase [Streptomyces tauricus]|uniref:SDR family NAD(P)-dependent oxidoreductase n=1 Tax=Streptomyces tauricus TaxID=68274 RepID=UPI00341A7F68